MNHLVALPIVIAFATAALTLLAWRHPRVQRALGLAGVLAHLASGVALFVAVWGEGVLAMQASAWRAPFGITLVADVLSALMVVLTGIVGLAGAVYAVADIGGRRASFAFVPLYHVLLAGVTGAFVTGDLFNLYVCFEVMLMASFVLLALGGERLELEGALKYVVLNLLSSALFLIAAGFVYGVTGTLNMAHLATALPAAAESHPDLVLAIGALLLSSFGIKAGVFPLYFWLPASYHTLPASIAAVFAGLLTKVGVYALLRATTLFFPGSDALYGLVVAIASVTMVLGVLGAFAQADVRRILSFHIVSQIGYMVLGIGLLVADDPATRRLAIAAAVFYIAHHIIVKTNLFLVGGAVRAYGGSFALAESGGLLARVPWLAVLFAIPAASLAGIPPLSGFWAKLGVIQAGIHANAWVAVAAALVAGLLTLLSMVKIWNEAFWKDAPPGASPATLSGAARALRIGPIAALALITLAIGLVPAPLFAVADRAAGELLDPRPYVQAVGGDVPPFAAEERP